MSFIAAGIGAAGAIGGALLPKLMGGSSSSTGTQAANQNSTTSSGPTPGSPYSIYSAQQLPAIQQLQNAPFQPYDVNAMFAPLNATQQQAFGQVQGMQQAWVPDFKSARGVLGNYDNVNPVTAGAGAFAQAGQQPTALQAAQPYTTAAAQKWTDPGVSSSYLNPYINNTVNAANQLQSQNFTNNVMPSFNNQFVASGGGLGSRQYGNAGNAALTNFNQNIGNTTQGALSNAYNSAAGIFANDQSRLAGLSGTVGNQATQGTGALTALGTALGNNAATGIQSGINQAGAYQGLGTANLNNGLLATNALLQTGNQAQQNAQNPLTAAYQQFQQSVQWPYQTQAWGANTSNQYQWPTTSSTTGGSAGSTGQTNSSTASPIGTGAGLAAAVGSIPGLTGGISNLFSGSGGLSGVPGGPGIYPNAKRGGHFDNIMRRARGGYFGMDAPSMPATIPNPGYFKWVEAPAFAEGGEVVDFAKARQARRGSASGIPTNLDPFQHTMRIFDIAKSMSHPLDHFDQTNVSTFPKGYDSGGPVPRGHFNYAAGGAAPVIKSGRKVTKRDIGAARAKRKAPSGGLTRPLDLSSAATARPGFLSRNANV